MNTRIGFSWATLAAALLLAMIVGTGSAEAQVIFTNPPCPNVSVINNTGCGAVVRLRTVPATAPFALPAGGIVLLPVPAAGLQVFGIFSAAGIFYPFNPPPPPVIMTPPCLPTDWWIQNVTLKNPFPPPVTCCFDICADPIGCTITLWPTTSLPPCNP